MQESVQHQLNQFLTKTPQISSDVFIAPTATVVGAVTIGPGSSVWYGAVVRADINEIRIGAYTNIQDLACLHVADEFPCLIGDRVTVGHRAILHACTVGDDCLIGMGAIILDGVCLGSRCLVGAGALITPGKSYPNGSLILGHPAKIVRTLTKQEQLELSHWAQKYIPVAQAHNHLSLKK